MLTRRCVLAGALGAMVTRAGAAAVQRGLAAAAAGVDPWLVARTAAALARHERTIWSRDVVGIADFGLPSALARFHLVDLLAGRTTTVLVTHGRGSDPDHLGMLQHFSDVPGSAATAQGAYLTGEIYTGVHGASRRLVGLDPTNANAEARAIVIHAAWYADAEVAHRQGRLGRSDGCFAFGARDIALVLARLGRGRLIYAGRRGTPLTSG